MNKIKNILWISALALTTSCSDFLETAPEDLFASDNFYQSAAQCEQGVIGVYADLDQIDNFVYLHMSECRSDNAWVEPQTNGLRDYSEIGCFRVTADLGMLDDCWNLIYKVIYDANVALQGIEAYDFGNDSDIKNQFLGEMYFMRAWMYFELARLWGNVPIVSEPLAAAQVAEITQSDATTVINSRVIPDLEQAVNLLPYKSSMVDASGSSISNDGRADKMAAQAMLARVYTTLAGAPYNDSSAQAQAKTLLQTILNYSSSNGDAYWAPDLDEWRKQWMPTSDYKNKYSIFAIQHTLGEERNYFVFNFSPELPPSYTSWRIFGNSIWIEKNLVYEFERTYSNGQVDGRGEGHSVLQGYEAEPNYPAYSNATEQTTLPDGTTAEVHTRTMYYKFLPSIRKLNELGVSFDEGAMLGYYDWPVNYPVLRLEDMMLLYAEILASEGNYTEAMTYVNKIRERAGCDPETATSATEAMNFIKRERRVELLGEGVRWFDLVRYGEWKSVLTAMFADYNNPAGTDVSNLQDARYIYPIPTDQMNAVPIYVQNTGY